jgi:putative flavoprotein involved in K+ transport
MMRSEPMSASDSPERFNTVIIGGGQSGLSVGYYLARRGVDFVILDENERVGDAWRHRWDSLRLFTPARFDGLVGMPFPASRHSFPSKDEMADYLESYARHFKLPVRTGTRVERLSRENGRYVVSSSGGRIEADNVVIAMANLQRPRVPAYARELDPQIVQMHSSEYKDPSQLKSGDVLIVGAGNSGAEIGLELARHGHKVWMSGRDVGHVPFRIDGIPARVALVPFLFRVIFHRVLTVTNPLGRKVRPAMVSRGGPLIRVKPKELREVGVERVPRVSGVRDGKPLLENGTGLDVANVLWCTGFDHGMSWIDLPVFDEHGEPKHASGISTEQPGIYFVGLHFLHAFSSTMIHGVARDAERVANVIYARRTVEAA